MIHILFLPSRDIQFRRVNKIYICSPGGSDSKEFAYDAGDPGSISQSGRSPGEGNDNPLQYSCQENPMDRGAWWAIVRGLTKSQTQLNQLSTHRNKN